MDTLTSQLVGLDITEICLLGKYLSSERDFIDEGWKKLKELNIEKINLVHYIGKAVMCVTFEGESLPSYEDTIKIIMLTEETFALKKIFKKIGWCANYMQGKGYNETPHGVCFNFAYVNHSPSHRGQEDHIIQFKSWKFILVNSLMYFTLNYLVTNNGRKKEVKIKKEGKEVLAADFHIHWATDYTIKTIGKQF